MYQPKDPRKSLRKAPAGKPEDVKFDDKLFETVDLGLALLARLLYRTRVEALGLSLKTFSLLITEDYRVMESQAGNANHDAVKVSDNLLHRIERAGSVPQSKSVGYLCHRLYNPKTKQAFKPVEMYPFINDQLDLEFDIKSFEGDDFLEKTRELNKAVDIKLGYRAPSE